MICNYCSLSFCFCGNFTIYLIESSKNRFYNFVTVKINFSTISFNYLISQEINISLPFSTSETPYLQGFQRLAFYKIFKSIIFVAKFFKIAPTLEFIRLCSASITTTSHWTFLTVAHSDTPTAKARWVLIYIHFQIDSKVYETNEFL